jgi:SAM-dependent methyltransferase
VFGPSVDRAATNAKAAGVTNRVSFRQLDASTGLPEQYDVITTFDVIHDAVDPRALLRSIRQALRPDGVYVCLDINCSERLEENAGPLGAMFHGFSVFYCMTTSLANGGVGLGTVGLHEPKVRELCAEAGFSSVRRVPLDNPFNNLYEVRP